jgi:hypothetical protein
VPDTTADEEALPVLEGPDPQHWPSHAPQLWSIIVDLEHLGRALAVLTGPVPQDAVGTHSEAVRFIRESAGQLRSLLAAEILAAYGLNAGESPFTGVGRARAFGAEQPTETTTP